MHLVVPPDGGGATPLQFSPAQCMPKCTALALHSPLVLPTFPQEENDIKTSHRTPSSSTAPLQPAMTWWSALLPGDFPVVS